MNRIFSGLCVIMMLASSVVTAAPPPDAGVILEETKLPPLVAPQKPPTPSIKVDENRPDQFADDKQQIPVKMFHLKGISAGSRDRADRSSGRRSRKRPYPAQFECLGGKGDNPSATAGLYAGLCLYSGSGNQ